MTRTHARRPALAAFVLTVAAAVVWPAALAAQPTPSPVGQGGKPAPLRAAPPDDDVFAEARTLDEGAAAQWKASATTALELDPTDRGAAVRAMAVALAAGRPGEAATLYRSWASAAGRDDAALLDHVAVATLAALDSAPTGDLRTRALEARAAFGDADARRLLETRAKSGEGAERIHAEGALARLGDRGAAAAVAARAVETSGSNRLGSLEALRGLPATPEVLSALEKALRGDDPMLQGRASDIAAEMKAASLVPALRQVMAGSRYGAPLRAAAALTVMKDPAGTKRAEEALQQQLPDIRLIAARALATTRSTTWVAAIEPILEDPNPIWQVEAAGLLLERGSPAATRVLQQSMASPNPVVRDEAMRVLAAHSTTPLAVLAAALSDDSPTVRLLAATSVRRLATKPTVPVRPKAPARPPAGRRR